MAFDLSSAKPDNETAKFDLASAKPLSSTKPPEEPGWFQPGSKSETAARTLSQAATFGMGDEIQAGLRSAPELFQSGGIQKYLESYRGLRDEERAANQASTAANPKTALASNVAGALIPGAAVVKAGRAAYTVPTMLAPATNAAIAAGAAGTAQGAARGFGESESLSSAPAQMAQQATFEGTLGSMAPGVDSLMGRFVQNYKDLRPAISGQIGPMTIGGTIGAAGGASGYLPSISGAIGDPAMTRQETWQSDPYSKTLDTVGYGVTGALLGKGVKELARTGGAVQKTMRGEGQAGRGIGGAYDKGPTGESGGGGAGGVEPPKGPVAPEGMPPPEARKAAQAQQSTPQGRAQTNPESPVNDRIKEARENMGSFGMSGSYQTNVPPPIQRPPQAMGDLVQGSDNVFAPQGQETPWATVMAAIRDKSEAATMKKLQEMPPTKATIPQLPGPETPQITDLDEYFRKINGR